MMAWMMRHADTLLSYEAIVRAVWPSEEEIVIDLPTRTKIRMLICRLRKKLDDYQIGSPLLVVRNRIGYGLFQSHGMLVAA